MTPIQRQNNGLGTKGKDNPRTTKVRYKNWQRNKNSYVQDVKNPYLMEKFYTHIILFPNLLGVKTHTKIYNSFIFSVTNKYITVDIVICLSRVLGNLASSVLRGERSSDAPDLPDYFLKPEDDATQLLDDIKEFLAQRGMEISEKKTKITAATDGFDFLGWHFKVQKNGKFRSRPSEDNYKAFRKKVKDIINSSNYGAIVKAKKLAPIVRGWRNYHRFCKMNETRNSLYYMQKRAFKVFNKEQKQNRYSSKQLLNQAFPAVPYSENKFVNVKGDKSPYDGDLVYWNKRNSKHYDGYTSSALKRQNHSCVACGLKFTSEEKVHLHHVDGNHDNWRYDNLVAIHESCHDYEHMSKSKR